MEMEPENLETEIQHFISFHIKSVAELDALLLLYHQPGRQWNAEDLSKELRSNPSHAESLLQQFYRTGLVEKKTDTEYSLKSDLEYEMKIIGQIVHKYQTRRYSLINMIYQSPTEKIKTFADAFKLRK